MVLAAPVLFAALASALLHAWWNCLAQQEQRPSTFLAGTSLAISTVAIFVAPFVSWPSVATWGWIIGAALCTAIYLRTLGEAYKRLSFCVAYAIVRAVVPTILFLAAWMFLAERNSSGAFVGLGVVVVGIFLFSIPAQGAVTLNLKGALCALTAGCLLATAILLDIHGIRQNTDAAGSLVGYVVASSTATSIAICIFDWTQGGEAVSSFLANRNRCYVGAAILLGAYTLGMWAYARGPVALVAPVRESSVLMVGVLSLFYLRQRVTKIQWIAMSIVTSGIVLIQTG